LQLHLKKFRLKRAGVLIQNPPPLAGGGKINFNQRKDLIILSIEFYSITADQSLRELESDAQNGLSAEQARQRLLENGPNRLKSAKKTPLILRIAAQFKDFLVLILIAAAVISVIAGDGLKDAVLIVCILLINVIISITQENRADNALA
jgi:Ca2+-transporting ATPase